MLLKNGGGLLPLDKTKLNSIAVIGPSANDVFIDWYAGMPPYTVTPLEGIRNKVGPNVRVRYVAGQQQQQRRQSRRRIRRGHRLRGQPSHLQHAVRPVRPPSEGKEAVDRKAIDLDPASST